MTRVRTRAELQRWSRRARVARALSPERTAALLSVVFVAVIGLVALGRPLAADGVGATPAPSTGAIPSATPLASGPPPSAAVTTAPWASAARALLGTDARLIELRDRLATAIAGDPATGEIARELRAMNTLLTGALAQIDAMASGGAPTGLIDTLRTTRQGALDANLETLQASLTNAAAYQAGAADVVEILASLEAEGDLVATEAGLPSAP